MDKLMPTIEMPQEEEKSVSVTIIDSETGEENSNLYPESELSDEDGDLIVKENIKEDIKEDDVFNEPTLSRTDSVVEEFVPSDKPAKRKYERKKPMTQKQTDHLARIRKIAQEKRQKEKERKANDKEEAQLKKVEERLLKKKQKEEEDKVVKETPPAQPRPHYEEEVAYKEKKLDKQYLDQQKHPKQFTQEDLDRAMLGAVSTYDTYRKQQKKEKKEQLVKDEKERKMKQTIQNAISPPTISTDPWRQFF
tara:strand:- start:801 stop:1550 length:750 start_codon:yes stop_codon:yes gene_type:complete